MYCIDQDGSPYELEEKPYAMPAKVVVEEGERPEEVLTTLEAHFQDLAEQFAQQELSRYYSRENRYEDGIAQPHFPVVLHDVSHSTKPRSIVVLPDGRHAVLLDPNRIQTLCGVQEIMPLHQAKQLRTRKNGKGECPRCHGRHLQDIQVVAEEPVSPPTPIPCQKCHANLRSSAYWDGSDTLVCLHCGTRISRPLVALSPEETDANDSAIQQAVVIETADPILPDQDDKDGLDSFGEELEDALHECTGDEDDHLSPYDETVSVELIPETTPLNQDELKDIHAILAHPSARFDATPRSTVFQHILALAEQRVIDPDNEQAFQTVLAQVISEEVGQLGDLIHAPACHLFKSSQSPLRQTLLDRAIQNTDSADRRMAVWAAAGRLLHHTTETWLKDFHADIDPKNVPAGRKARAAFWADLRQRRKADVQPIIEWLEQLSREDLALLAGDPDTSHPFVHCPDPDVFQPTHTLLDPLIHYLANELQRFRQTSSGCQLLAGDYGLDVRTLETIAHQSKQGLPQAPHPTVPQPSRPHLSPSSV